MVGTLTGTAWPLQQPQHYPDADFVISDRDCIQCLEIILHSCGLNRGTFLTPDRA